MSTHDRVTIFGADWPDDHRDRYERRLAYFGGPAGLARHETLLAIHQSGIGADLADTRKELRHFGRLLQERVSRPQGGDWLTVDEAGRLLGMTRKAVYCEIERHPTGPLAMASTRLGHRLRWSRAGIEELLRKRPGTARVRPRVPSPRKETTR